MSNNLLARLEAADAVLAKRGVSFNIDHRTDLSLRLLQIQATEENTAAVLRLMATLIAPAAPAMERLLDAVAAPSALGRSAADPFSAVAAPSALGRSAADPFSTDAMAAASMGSDDGPDV